MGTLHKQHASQSNGSVQQHEEETSQTVHILRIKSQVRMENQQIRKKMDKCRQRGGPCRLEEDEEEEKEEECVAEFQKELQRRLCSPADSRSWLPRRLFIRLQGGTRDRERAEIRKRRRVELEVLERSRGEANSTTKDAGE